jgi:hypothetical protein
MLQKPRHSFRRARQALHDVIGEFPVLANEMKLAMAIPEELDCNMKGNDEKDAGKIDVEQEAQENTTREESVESKVDRIVCGALAKVEVNHKQLPLLCSFKKSKDENFIARHILDGLLTEIYGLLGSTHRTVPPSALSAASNDTSMTSLGNECLKMTRL